MPQFKTASPEFNHLPVFCKKGIIAEHFQGDLIGLEDYEVENHKILKNVT